MNQLDGRDATVAQISTAPTLPREVARALRFDPDIRSAGDTIVRLVTVLDDPRSDSRAVEDAIQTDVALTAQVLRTANSPLYRGAASIKSVREAVSRLGFSTVRHLTLSAVAMSAFRRPDPVSEMLWRHSLLVATLTRTLMKWRSPPGDAELGFTAGLLHDLGKLLLLQAFPKRYKKVFEQATHNGWSSCAAEQAEFGCTHAEVGAALAIRWYLDPGLHVPMRYHHRLDALANLGVDSELKKLVMSVRIAGEIFRAQHIDGERIAQLPVDAPPTAVVRVLGAKGYNFIWTEALNDYRRLGPIFD